MTAFPIRVPLPRRSHVEVDVVHTAPVPAPWQGVVEVAVAAPVPVSRQDEMLAASPLPVPVPWRGFAEVAVDALQVPCLSCSGRLPDALHLLWALPAPAGLSLFLVLSICFENLLL